MSTVYVALDENRKEIQSFESFSQAAAFWEKIPQCQFINDVKQMIVKDKFHNKTVGYIVHKSVNKIATVNVIEIQVFPKGIAVNKIVSFADNPEGNREAELTFEKFLKEYPDWKLTEDEIEEAIENSYWCHGDVSILISHSTENN